MYGVVGAVGFVGVAAVVDIGSRDHVRERERYKMRFEQGLGHTGETGIISVRIFRGPKDRTSTKSRTV